MHEYCIDGFYAIEVKKSAMLHLQHLLGLKALGVDYPECKILLLYRGKESLLKDGILCGPCKEFLRALHPSNNFPYI